MPRILFDQETNSREHRNRISNLLVETKGPIRIVSPYLSETKLLTELERHGNEVQLLTSTDPEDLIRNSTDIDVLEMILKSPIKCKYFSGHQLLHAKVYIFGKHAAIVTSANFTRSAFEHNIEVGVEFSGDEVLRLCKWFDQMWEQEEFLELSHLTRIKSEIMEQKHAYKDLARSQKRLTWGFRSQKSKPNQRIATEENNSFAGKKWSIRRKVFHLLAAGPKTGKEISRELYDGKENSIPNCLKDEQVDTTKGTPFRIVAKKIPGQRAVEYSLTESGIRAINDGTIDTDLPPSTVGQRAPGQL